MLRLINKLQHHDHRSYSDRVSRLKLPFYSFLALFIFNFCFDSFSFFFGFCFLFCTAFEVPDLGLSKQLIVDGFVISMVSYTVSVSMGLIFAQKLNYEINFNQELLAMGASNVCGSFFSCLPLSASLSRSVIQESTGGRTQIASLISCGLLTFVLLWVGPFFELLPRVCVRIKSNQYLAY